MAVNFELSGIAFMALNGGPQYKFSMATSHVIHCEDQAEADYFWSKLGEGVGVSKSTGGWLQDQYGVVWQIVRPSMM